MSRSDAKKDAILKAATDLLATRGGPHLTMRQVADHSGISLGNLQYHFANRATLLAAVLDRFLDHYEQLLETIADEPANDVAASLEALFLKVFTGPGFEECAAVFKELWAEAQHNQEMKHAMTAYYQRLAKFYTALLCGISGMEPDAPALGRAVSVMVPLLEGYCVTGNVMGTSDQALARSWAHLIARILEGDLV